MADIIRTVRTVQVTLRVFGTEEEPRDYVLKAKTYRFTCCPLGRHAWTEWSLPIRAEILQDGMVVMVPGHAFFQFRVCTVCGQTDRREVLD